MNHEQRIVHAVEDALALERALVQTLTAHVAMAPRSEYRDLLERHLTETRGHARALSERLSQLGRDRNPLELAYGLATGALGQVVAAGRLPLDLLRGTAGEEKLLRNARDEAASEALEIATYDALEALAQAAGDEQTAKLARAHRSEEEAFLRDLRAQIGQLARDVVAGDALAGEDGSYSAARTVADEVRRSVERKPAPKGRPRRSPPRGSLDGRVQHGPKARR